MEELIEFLKLSFIVKHYTIGNLTYYNWHIIAPYFDAPILSIRINVSYVYDNDILVYRQQFSHDNIIRIQYDLDMRNNIIELPPNECIDFLIRNRLVPIDIIRDYQLSKLI
jgi:hypothetical protein